jgi:2-dehydropantoate 2-reductase
VRKRIEALLGMGDRWEEMVGIACRMAVEARNESGKPDTLIAGSLPPLHGSYNPDGVGEFTFMRKTYGEHVELMKEHVDLFLCETMSSAEEGRAAAEAAKESGKPVWVSWNIKDDGTALLRNGETLEQAFEAVRDLSPEAVLVNCCTPESVMAAIPHLRRMGPAIFGGHANGFTHIPEGWLLHKAGMHSLKLNYDLTPDSYVKYVENWVESGARAVGGCCEVGPAFIAAMRDQFTPGLSTQARKVDVDMCIPCNSDEPAAPPAKRQCMSERVIVLGCGAMGSVYAALMSSAGYEVWATDVWKDHVDAIREKGLRVEGASGDRTVRINVTMNADELPPADLVIIATKASGVEAAAKVAATVVKTDGVILTIQNGLGAGDRIAQHIDTSKVMLGVASNFGACLRGPGHAEHKSMNLVNIGEMNGGSTERLDRIVRIWTNSGFKAQASPDINKMIWEKLICNCFCSGSCTLTDSTVGEMVDNPHSVAVALACAREADAVARAKGINLSFTDVEAHVKKFAEAVRNAKPSMLQDHVAKRRGEVDAINGAIPIEAKKVGLTAPVNEMVANLVRAREQRF